MLSISVLINKIKAIYVPISSSRNILYIYLIILIFFTDTSYESKNLRHLPSDFILHVVMAETSSVRFFAYEKHYSEILCAISFTMRSDLHLFFKKKTRIFCSSGSSYVVQSFNQRNMVVMVLWSSLPTDQYRQAEHIAVLAHPAYQPCRLYGDDNPPH